MLDKKIENEINFDFVDKIVYFCNFDFDNCFDNYFDNYYVLILIENYIVRIN